MKWVDVMQLDPAGFSSKHVSLAGDPSYGHSGKDNVLIGMEVFVKAMLQPADGLSGSHIAFEMEYG